VITDDKRQVLAPSEARELFHTRGAALFEPWFYDYRPYTLTDRIARRLRRPLRSRIRLDPAANVAPVTALWLGGAVSLDRAETAALLERLPRLEWVYSQATGTEHLPLDLYRARGITVSNTGQLTALWVAETNVACVVNHAKRLAEHDAQQRRHEWRALWTTPFAELTVLIVGTGAIGGHTARMCRALGMRTIGASRNPDGLAAGHAFDRVEPRARALTDAVRDAAAVVLAVPLTPDTTQLVSADVLARMQPGAALVNLARPRVVDERAMIAALGTGRLGSVWVSRTEALGRRERRRADRMPGFHLTHVSEGHVAAKLPRAFEQFAELAARQRRGDVGFRVV
jgi:phosphoglycerate dehydrogenase-like enzyme